MHHEAPPSPAGKLEHLPALDGMRGIAVALVVAFHAHWLAGGYVGVDVFFVLSGFLITRLLLAEHLRSGRIDLVRFWQRRVRRLMPALLLLIVVTAGAERWRQRLDGPAGGRIDVIGALTYSTNWLRLQSGAGYWSKFEEPALLAHTWSLAIEEQFYVLWPIVVWVLLRVTRAPRKLTTVLGLAVVACGAWSLYSFELWGDASRVYMGTDTRAVALVLGATVAALTMAGFELARRGATVAAFVGMGLIGWASVSMRGDLLTTYRGGLLACSVAGAVVIAALAGPQVPTMLACLTARPLRWLGARSYGIYLWHWPIMVAFGVADAPTSSNAARLAAVASSLVAAEASYRLVESPVRSRGLRAFGRPSTLLVPGAVVVVASIALIAVPLRDESSVALPQLDVLGSDQPDPAAGEPESSVATTVPVGSPTSTIAVATDPGLALPAGRVPRVMFVGDSVGWYLGENATGEAARFGIEALNAAQPECPPSYTPLRRRNDEDSVPLSFPERCEATVNEFRDLVGLIRPDVVIVVFGASLLDENEIAPSEWHAPCSTDFDDWNAETTRRIDDDLRSSGATVIWATQAYYRAEVNDRTPLLDDQIDCQNEVLNELDDSDGLQVLDLGGWACPTRECLTERDGFELRSDGTHFRDAGAFLANAWLLEHIFTTPPWEISTPSPSG